MRTFFIILIALPLCLFGDDSMLSHVVTPRGENNPLKENKALVKEFYESIEKNDVTTMNGLLSSSYKVQDSNVVFDSAYSKYDAFSKNLTVRLKSLHDAFSDLKVNVIEMVAEGNKVLARIQISGVQRGSFLGVEATNKPVIMKVFALLTINGGKISHLNESWNELGVMKQMGYIIL